MRPGAQAFGLAPVRTGDRIGVPAVQHGGDVRPPASGKQEFRIEKGRGLVKIAQFRKINSASYSAAHLVAQDNASSYRALLKGAPALENMSNPAS
jgi:hypothetical protein